ncbi:MAG: ABC transporter permease [Chloroflexi bacterium]|nr:ABC transporter permease [Chloroflexota bacterium]
MASPYNRAVYDAEPQLRRPLLFLRGMFSDIRSSRELAWILLMRNLRSQYRKSILGYVWAVLPTLVTTLIWVFLNQANVMNVGETDIPYPVYVLVGTMLWQGFVDALNSPLRQVTASASILTKINFPREALILAGLGETLFNFGIRLVLVLLLFVILRIPIPSSIVMAPIGFFALLGFGTTIGIFMIPIGILYSDIERAMVLLTSLWFFVTPVVYPSPTTWPASLLANLNPVSSLLVTSRELMTTGNLSQVLDFSVVTILTAILLFMSWVVYKLAIPHITSRLMAR